MPKPRPQPTSSTELNTDVELRYEELAQIEEAVEKTRQQISVASSDLERATDDVNRSEALLNRRVSNIYRTGAVDMVAVFVGATDFQDFVARIDLMRRVGRNDASLVASVKEAKARVETAKRALETRESEQVTLREQARRKQIPGASRRRRSSRGTSHRSRPSSRSSSTRSASAWRRSPRPGQPPWRRRRGLPQARTTAGCFHSTPRRSASRIREVVAIAKRYLRVPYVWGGTTPAGFDCSGLMQYSYQQIGISLPRTSRTQFHAGAYIPPNRLDLLEPGDMVFFGVGGDPDQIHHVGMYVGGGDFIHAPATGDVVRITSLAGRIASRGDYVGACRP